MSLSPAFLNAHIAEWEDKLNGPVYSHRAKWPGRLFHHTAIENAEHILRSGLLLSREDSEGRRIRDVAGTEVIQSRHRAHQFARLYFRPRTPTQFHIEGIRRSDEIYQGAHAPVLVMLVFDARRVLATNRVRFSDGNMQSDWTTDDDTEDFFKAIDWASVYHEGPTHERAIFSRRCAEVLVPSPYSVGNSLQWVYCRSAAERTMLLHALGSHGRRWTQKIVISDDIRVFEKKYTYVEDVALQGDGVVFRLHRRVDGQPIAVRVDVWDPKGSTYQDVLQFLNEPGPPKRRALDCQEHDPTWLLPRPYRTGELLCI
jgi:hypothetical protein